MATTARQAGSVAAIRGRSEVSIGIPCSSAIFEKDLDCLSVVKPLSS